LIDSLGDDLYRLGHIGPHPCNLVSVAHNDITLAQFCIEAGLDFVRIDCIVEVG